MFDWKLLKRHDGRPILPGKRWKAVAVVTTTVVLYGLCGYWLWARRETLQASLRFPLAQLGLALVAALLVLMLKPWRHQWLLRGCGVSVSWVEALRDRLVMGALKIFTPWMVGDPYGYLMVGRREGLELERLAPLWLLDKWLTLAAILLLGAVAALWWAATLWLAAGAGVVLLGALLLWGGPGPASHPAGLRRRLMLVALAQEGLQLAGFAVLLAGVVEGGWGALRGYEIVLVHLAGMLPTLLGGAGSREAAVLLVFSGRGDDRALFLAAFTATLVLRVVPSLPGVLWYLRWIRRGVVAPAEDERPSRS